MDVEYGVYKVPQRYVDDSFEFIQKSRSEKEFVEICWSDDINEELEHGDYQYEYMEITPNEEYWLCMNSTHPWGIPNRIIKFNLSYQIHLEEGYDEVEICPINMNWFEAFLTIKPLCIQRLKELLRSSDRPRLINKIRNEY